MPFLDLVVASAIVGGVVYMARAQARMAKQLRRAELGAPVLVPPPVRTGPQPSTTWVVETVIANRCERWPVPLATTEGEAIRTIIQRGVPPGGIRAVYPPGAIQL